MSDLAIRVENVSKLYQLGQIGTGTLSNDLRRWWAEVRGKEDPFTQIGRENDRTKASESEFVWALRNLSFDVKEGEVLGIIGRNGAGKSTLLKILSKITSPTSGKIYLHGRIASLLEVGTGFHPEMSGRENIFLNGAILGMRRWEILKKFDEIVDFAGVEAYIDTPVKRYSSGMYVRLAFAVAAFLEPEILVVDEVLAVGDAEFQKKCLGRMKDVSQNDGRTVLFVSHNMGAIKNLCTKAIIFRNGNLMFDGSVDLAVKKYIEAGFEDSTCSYHNKSFSFSESGVSKITAATYNGEIRSEFGFDEEVSIFSEVYIKLSDLNARLCYKIYDKLDNCVFTTEVAASNYLKDSGELRLRTLIPSKTLMPGLYRIQFALHIPNITVLELLRDVISFEILETGSEFYLYPGVDNGSVFVECKWEQLS